MLPFAIVAFENNGGLAVIPTKWFTGGEEDECYWPPAKINMAKAVAEQLEPHTDWATFKLTVKRKAATYGVARSKLVEYEENTDVLTESDSENLGKGQRKRRKVIFTSEDEDDDSPIGPTAPSSLRSLPTATSSLRSSPTAPSYATSSLGSPPTAPSYATSSLRSPPTAPSFATSSLRSPPTAPSFATSSLKSPPTPPSYAPSSLGSPPTAPSSLRSPPTAPSYATSSLRTPPTAPSYATSSLRSPPTAPSPVRDSMFVRILTLLEEVKETQKIHGRMLQTLLQQRGTTVCTVSSTPEGFPLKTVQDVMNMEEKLANTNVMSELVAVVADIGGATIDEATRRMMAFLLDHGLSRNYNLLG
ncbi:pectinesterase inhibitor 10-like [Hypomesus transpacificus]|uniref:pectinesterase inhibitor 10-like n=1 Tax=Hypomesus transpacificus TaxID=137520 RepID=UPI001F078B2E|nr:pectinesterase inhibitor 10-like [Hypomesus transpacificus]